MIEKIEIEKMAACYTHSKARAASETRRQYVLYSKILNNGRARIRYTTHKETTSYMKTLVYLVFLAPLAGDVEVNPGPQPSMDCKIHQGLPQQIVTSLLQAQLPPMLPQNTLPHANKMLPNHCPLLLPAGNTLPPWAHNNRSLLLTGTGEGAAGHQTT